jgi:C-terminal processing protease CtpA/Prc
MHGLMYLKPYRTEQRPFKMDRSGLILVAYGAEFNEFVVRDIADRSPASEAGIQAGDELVKIQGIPAHHFTLDGLNLLFQRKPGKTIKLVIRRDHKEIHKSFILRDLI